MNILWVSGWSIPRDWMAGVLQDLLPADRHEIILPTADWEAEFLQKVSEADRIAGHSFGAFLLLQKPGLWKGKSARFFAPCLSFKSESGLGSKISTTQIKFLKRWLSKAPLEALTDFDQRAGLSLSQREKLPYSLEDLLWGLDMMLSTEIAEIVSDNDIRYYIGTHDPLFDGTLFMQNVTSNNQNELEKFVVLSCNHDIRFFLIESAEHSL